MAAKKHRAKRSPRVRDVADRYAQIRDALAGLPDESQLGHLLFVAHGLARDRGEPALARVLWTLSQVGDFEWLGDARGVAAKCDQHLRKQFSDAETVHGELAPQVLAGGHPTASALIDTLMASGRRVRAPARFAEWVWVMLVTHDADELIGAATGSSVEETKQRMVEQCERVAKRSSPREQLREHYLVACLKGWGLPPTRARRLLKRWL